MCVKVFLAKSQTGFRNDIFKNVNLNLLPRSRMTSTVTEDRLKRLVESGLRGSCRPRERVSELRKRAKEVDDLALRRLREVFSAVADETRLKMLELIRNEELCACELMAALELTQPTTSHHLGILERSGLVTSRREGKWVFYRLAHPKVEPLLTKGIQIVKWGP